MPEIYHPDHHPLVAKLGMMMGLTLGELASEIGVAKRTLHKWKKEHLEFAEALRHGKASADGRVADSLYRRALGFEAEETHVEADERGAPRRIRKVKKTVPPDVTACIFWLKNRRPDLWRDTYTMDGALNVAVNDALQKALDNLERILQPEQFRLALQALSGGGRQAPSGD